MNNAEYMDALDLLCKKANEMGITGMCVSAKEATELIGCSRAFLYARGLKFPITLTKLARVISQ